MIVNRRSASCCDRLLVGSSNTISRAPCPMADAICSICCWPMVSDADRARDIQRDVYWREQPFRSFSHLTSGYEAAGGRQIAEAQVLGNGQVLAERQFLVDHRHPGGERLGRAVETDGISV